MPQHHNFDSILSPNLSLRNATPSQTSQTSKEERLLNLLDKYVKVNNNLLPLTAYLKHLEGEDHWNSFSPICDISSSTEVSEKENDANADKGSTYSATAASLTMALTRQANTMASLSLQRTGRSETASKNPSATKIEDRAGKESCESVLLAQKYYKLIVSIDYAPQSTSLRFVEKSLQQLFKKLADEFDEFYSKYPQVSRNDPKVFLTVLLWNRTFTSPSNVSPSHASPIEHPSFIILFHSKLLTRSNG